MTLVRQGGADAAPVLLINNLHVDPGSADGLMVARKSDAELLDKQPGHMSTQPQRGIGGDGRLVDCAAWAPAVDYVLAWRAFPEARKARA